MVTTVGTAPCRVDYGGSLTANDRDAAEVQLARRRIRRRGRAQMSLIIAPVLVLGAVVKILERHDYPAGDVRNDPLFWIVTGAFLAVVAALLIIRSIRILKRGDADPRPAPTAGDVRER